MNQQSIVLLALLRVVVDICLRLYYIKCFFTLIYFLCNYKLFCLLSIFHVLCVANIRNLNVTVISIKYKVNIYV